MTRQETATPTHWEVTISTVKNAQALAARIAQATVTRRRGIPSVGCPGRSLACISATIP